MGKLAICSRLVMTLVAIIALLFNVSRIEAVTHPADSEALMRIKASIDPRTIPATSCLGTWDFHMDPCEAAFQTHFTCGIECTNQDNDGDREHDQNNIPFTSSSSSRSQASSIYQRVTRLVFDNAGYAGVLSPYVGNLTELRILRLTGNMITGAVPDSISNLSHLTVLDLSSNGFTGLVPHLLGNLACLQTLDLSHNNLQGALPQSLNRLTSLTKLSVRTNELTGTIPDLRNLTLLRQLDLSGNKLSGALPISFLPGSISSIALRNNNFSGKLSRLPISSLTHLVVLDLSQNRFSGCVNDAMLAHGSLQQVNMSGNMLTQLRVRGKHLLESPLVALDISYNLISGQLPNVFALMKELSALSLRYNFFHGMIPPSYGVKATANGILAKPLERLLLDGNYLIGPLPTQFMTELLDRPMLASFSDNCLTHCPMQYAFCQGKTQKAQTLCRLFNPSQQ